MTDDIGNIMHKMIGRANKSGKLMVLHDNLQI